MLLFLLDSLLSPIPINLFLARHFHLSNVAFSAQDLYLKDRLGNYLGCQYRLRNYVAIRCGQYGQQQVLCYDFGPISAF